MDMPTRTNTPPTSRSLEWRTRDTTRHLMEALAVATGITLTTGIALWIPWWPASLTHVALLLHLLAGALCLLLFVPYIVFHLRDGHESWRDLVWPFALVKELAWDRYAAKRLHGHALMWALSGALLSGATLSLPGLFHLAGQPQWIWPYGASAVLLLAHEAFTIVSFFLFFWHLPMHKRT